MTLYPFIFLKQEELRGDRALINHEKIHLKQQLELGVVFFYFFYGLEWLIKLFKYKDAYRAYENLSFEREAYQNEHDLGYVEDRKFWAFLRYL